MTANYVVTRSTSIAASPSRIFSELVDFHRWAGWSPWEDLDPDLQRSYAGSATGVGAVYTWSGNRKAGEGRMEITDVDDPSRVAIALDFLKPFKSSSVTTFELVADGDATGVTWSMTGPKTFATRVMGIFTSMDKLIGPDFEKGLARLKAVAERSA